MCQAPGDALAHVAQGVPVNCVVLQVAGQRAQGNVLCHNNVLQEVGFWVLLLLGAKESHQVFMVHKWLGESIALIVIVLQGKKQNILNGTAK